MIRESPSSSQAASRKPRASGDDPDQARLAYDPIA